MRAFSSIPISRSVLILPLLLVVSEASPAVVVTPEQLRTWNDRGFVIFRDFLGAAERAQMTRFVGEIQRWAPTRGEHMIYYETVGDRQQLCRTENYLDFHPGLARMVGPSSRLAAVATALLGDPSGVRIFKERINYKLPGGGGFAPHQDAPAWSGASPTAPDAEAPFIQSSLNVNIAIDAMHPSNGGLAVLPGLHRGGRLHPQNADGTLTQAFCDTHAWQDVVLEPGDALVFSLYLPHRSGPNTTPAPRRAVYITYSGVGSSGASDRAEYYARYRRLMPPAGEQVAGVDYSAGHAIYNWATPMAQDQPHKNQRSEEEECEEEKSF